MQEVSYRFRIEGQLFKQSIDQFVIMDTQDQRLLQMSVKEIFANKDMLFQFSPADISALSFTAGVHNILQEQETIDVMRRRLASSVH